jgi:hypothetical protein
MLKYTILVGLFVSACAVEPNTSETSQLGTSCDSDCECKPPEALCTTKKEGTVDLNTLQVAGDNKVTFCHATGSETNPFILITTSVEGCVEGHFDHEPGGNEDIFPTTGCAD